MKEPDPLHRYIELKKKLCSLYLDQENNSDEIDALLDEMDKVYFSMKPTEWELLNQEDQ